MYPTAVKSGVLIDNQYDNKNENETYYSYKADAYELRIDS